MATILVWVNYREGSPGNSSILLFTPSVLIYKDLEGSNFVKNIRSWKDRTKLNKIGE
jgi:hypothetical protein